MNIFVNENKNWTRKKAAEKMKIDANEIKNFIEGV